LFNLFSRNGSRESVLPRAGRFSSLPCLATLILFALATAPARAVAQSDAYDTLFNEASLNYRSGNYETALRLFSRANDLKEDGSPECLWRMVEIYSKMGLNERVLQTCDRLIQISGNDLFYLVKAWNTRGNVLFATSTDRSDKSTESRLLQAEAAFQEVLKISPELNMARYNLGLTLLRLKRVDEGVAELKAFIKNGGEESIIQKARRYIENPQIALATMAPDFSFLSPEGDSVSSEDLRGKVVLLNFWGVWSKACLGEFPELSKLVKKYQKDPFVLLNVDIFDPEAKWIDYVTGKKVPGMHAHGGASGLTRLFAVNKCPTYILIDNYGVLRYRAGALTPFMLSQLSFLVEVAAAYKDRPGEKIEPSQQEQRASLPVSPDDSAVSLKGTADGDDQQPEVDKTYTFRIPKPVVELVPRPIDVQDGTAHYSLHILNWASMPDELFIAPSKLPPCSMPTFDDKSFGATRIEISVWMAGGSQIATICGPPSPESLKTLYVTIPKQLQANRIFITVKDRFTGNSTQSDMIELH
jgi:tetratricopeptide (TPR) repeat protein